MSRALLLIAAALAFASPARAADAQFRDWWAACDEQRTCWAFGFAPEDRPGEAFVRIERSGAANAEPVVLLGVFDEGRPGSPLRVRVDYAEPPGFRLDLPTRASDDSPHKLAEVRERGAARSLIAAVRQGAALKLRYGSGEEAQVSLDGATAALLWMDEQQRRVGTTTALVRTGPRLAANVPAVPTQAAVRAGPMMVQTAVPETWPRFVAAQPEVRACLSEIQNEFARTPVNARLDARTILWGVPCSQGAYNTSYEFFLGDAAGAGWRRAEFFNGRKREPADFALVNAAFEGSTMTLSAFSKGRGLGDCGEVSRWTWDGRRFVLTEQSVMRVCRGVPSEFWPTVRNVAVTR